MKKFTFKKIKHSNRYITKVKETSIKLSGKQVGYLIERSDHTWCIRLAIKRDPTTASPAPFRWVTLKHISLNEIEAREFVKMHYKNIQRRYELYPFNDK